MTNEEAIAILIREIDEDPFLKTEYREKIHEALKMGIKALGQMDALDKIVAEIEYTAKDYDKFADYRRIRGLWIALEIIDKYRKEQI